MEELLEVIEPFTWLKGNWRGHGTGGFPTIEPFEFDDQMEFKLLEEDFKKEPLIRFDETAWLIAKGKHNFMHWETGFIRPLGDGTVQLYVSHNTARMEFTVGKFESVDHNSKSFKIVFSSIFLRNDTGLKNALQSKRTISFDRDQLTYDLDISTDEHPELTSHLKVLLKRI
ncbi:MAG: heme-binding beta-barrel domain-containing protein [Reichenbachiella sp.]|uniref:FABP family protein n=2 Tax=Reichenbachiella sp. TaxID=2184521 RepID=UPI0032672F37